jgi:GH15 family glucan-1,4-alpha-glucosidase
MFHKYNPDGSLASSWLPWAADGEKNLPIQEDETSLVLWALWEHFSRYGDVSFIKPLYRTLICPLADFIAGYRDKSSGLPLPSYDLWEERRGILSWTIGATRINCCIPIAKAFGECGSSEKISPGSRGDQSWDGRGTYGSLSLTALYAW